MLPHITKTQKKIIHHLIYKYRFLTRIHIQQLLFHKNPAKINIWLKDLTEKKYLKRIYSSKYGENIKPGVYYIGSNGIRLTKSSDPENSKYIQNLYYEKKRSSIFHQHCFAFADFACHLFAYAKEQNKKAILFTRAEFTKDTDETSEILQTINPDGFYTYTGSGIAKSCFIEVVDDITPAYVLRRKIRKYVQASQEMNWEILNSERFPSIVFLLQNRKKMESLTRAVRRVKNEIDDDDVTSEVRCNLALVSDIQTNAIASNIWHQV